MPARRGLSVARRASPVAGAQPRFRPQPDRHHLLARFRFRGSRFSGAGHGWLRAGLGLVSAAALVHPDPVRPGGARRAALRFARAVRRPCGAWRWPISASRCFGCGPSPANPRRRRSQSTTGRHGPASRGAFVTEYGRVLRDRGAFGLFVLGAHHLWRVLSAALSRTAGPCRTDRRRRRRFIGAQPEHHPGPERFDEALRVAARSSTLAEAQQALARREVFAIVDIPAGTEREVLAGRQARLPAYVDSAYFLLYNRTLQGILEATGDRDRPTCCRAMRGPTAACIARRWRKALPWRC